MARRTRWAAWAAAAGWLAAAPAASAAEAGAGVFRLPDAAVAAIYARPTPPRTTAELRRFFTADLARALAARKGDDGRPDWRYGGGRPARPRLEDYAGGPGEEVIRVHLPGGPVDYLVCLHAPDDWRIKDVTAPKRGSLRKSLGLRPAESVDAC